jgi:hypothetical protein
MANQGNLFSPRNEPTAVVQAVPQQRPARHIPRWLSVLELSLFVLLRLYVGALVFLLPWRSIWTTNAWIIHLPTVANFISQGWVRGLVSGLGLLNVWVALSVLFRRRRT